MPTKVVLTGADAREATKRGIDMVADPVKTTLGPDGRTVVLGHKYGSKITKDGVTVANAIQPQDENMAVGANIIKEVSRKTVAEAGDGTTTAMILAQAILTEGFKLTSVSHSPVGIKRGIDKAVAYVVDQIKKIAIPIEADSEKLKQIATISANNDVELGEKIAEAYKKTGKEGVITIDDSSNFDTTVTAVEGMQFNRGYVSPYFINDFETLSTQYQNPFILVVNGKVSAKRDIFPILKKIHEHDAANNGGLETPLLVIAEDVTDEALGIMLTNREKRNASIVAVKSPSFGDDQLETLRDICAIVGATLCNSESGIRSETMSIEQLGKCEKILVTKDETTIVNGDGEDGPIQARIDFIRKSIEQATNEFEKKQLELRLAKMQGGVAILSVGAGSEVERNEKKDRCDDALCATSAALKEGIVPGGGIVYIRCIDGLNSVVEECSSESEKAGVKLIQRVLEYPFLQMVANGDVSGLTVADIKKQSIATMGYNFKTHVMEDLVETGVVDPAKVVRVALVNAASVASVLLTSQAMVINVDDPNMQMPNFKR